MNRQLLFLELNEVNFDYVRFYCERGMLPNLHGLIKRHGIGKTYSEQRYEELEPWIQWVSAHTGMSFAQHGVFRLGDIVKHDIPQIWECLEEQGLRVGAISPMNAKNRLRAPEFFVPDPWTPTTVSAPLLLRKLSGAISQAVNENAQARITLRSLFWLLAGIVSQARTANYAAYAKLALTGSGRPWCKAMFLDLLLADVFISEVRRTQPHFASLFLNAAAHIQHHYMFSAACYEGTNRNPAWYIAPGVDPVREVYELYDRIVCQVQMSFPRARIMIATGLHQDPHPTITYYWRLKNHAKFLKRIGAPFQRVEPRMSRDFVVYCASTTEAEAASIRLREARVENGLPLFEVDNRGKDIFVMLTYPREITPKTAFSINGKNFGKLHDHVVFVALKNGQHNGIGYFIDTGRESTMGEEFPLTEIPNRICVALGVSEFIPTPPQ